MLGLTALGLGLRLLYFSGYGLIDDIIFRADIEAIVRGEISPAIMVNDLAAAAIAQFPEIRRLKALLEESGARAAQMSGSGGAVFGVFDSIEDAQRAAEKVKRRAPFATVTAATTLDPEAPC